MRKISRAEAVEDIATSEEVRFYKLPRDMADSNLKGAFKDQALA
jgi:hypothetical protein